MPVESTNTHTIALLAWQGAGQGDSWLRTGILLCVIFLVLTIAWGVGRILKRQPDSILDPAVVRTFNRRVKVSLIIYAVLTIGIIFGPIVCVVLFGLVSFWALREFITMTPTRLADHRALFWTFFLFTPLQYLFVAIGSSCVHLTKEDGWHFALANSLGLVGFDFYLLYTIMIPVYGSLLIPARIALSNDHKRFLERSAKVQFGLLICVYALSFAPAILDLNIQTFDAKINMPEVPPPQAGANVVGRAGLASLLVYFVVIVQISELMQFCWDRIIGRHVIASEINASKTWQGFLGGLISTGIIGIMLWWTGITPFTWFGSGLMAAVVAIMGFAGSMTMSAIKRDRGVQDYGTLVQGHAGVLDRIDSMCFAAPVFFHLTRFYLGV